MAFSKDALIGHLTYSLLQWHFDLGNSYMVHSGQYHLETGLQVELEALAMSVACTIPGVHKEYAFAMVAPPAEPLQAWVYVWRPHTDCRPI